MRNNLYQMAANISQLKTLAKSRIARFVCDYLCGGCIADSGVESRVNLAKFLAQGANIVFAGGAFMYGVGALGKARARHVFGLLQTDLPQVLGQLRCPHPNLLKNFRIE
jgi:hypothetical protein